MSNTLLIILISIVLATLWSFILPVVVLKILGLTILIFITIVFVANLLIKLGLLNE